MCLFDLNGTLLDLSVLDPHFEKAFGDPAVRSLWFRQTVELALAQTAMGAYSPFDLLAEAALDMMAARRGVALTAGGKKDILAGMTRLPAFPEVPAALGLLREHGFRLAALTNSVLAAAEAQAQHAELMPYFEQIFSTDTVRQFKPGPRPYHHAVEELGAAPSQVCLIAAHSWDVAGAMAAGLTAAFVSRPDQALNPSGPQPRIIAADMPDMARQIIQNSPK